MACVGTSEDQVCTRYTATSPPVKTSVKEHETWRCQAPPCHVLADPHAAPGGEEKAAKARAKAEREPWDGTWLAARPRGKLVLAAVPYYVIVIIKHNLL
jgi:hypothetical protein